MADGPAAPRIRRLTTTDLSPAEVRVIRAIMDSAFRLNAGPFSDDDWEHALGGTHFVLDVAGEIVTHASVVERELHVAGKPLRTGYVEAVATTPARDGQGFGSLVMEAVNEHIEADYELGALGTGRHHFYERLGWVRWAGPTFVRLPEGPRRTADEDGDILILKTPSSPLFDLTEPLSCEWRPGDVW